MKLLKKGGRNVEIPTCLSSCSISPTINCKLPASKPENVLLTPVNQMSKKATDFHNATNTSEY